MTIGEICAGGVACPLLMDIPRIIPYDVSTRKLSVFSSQMDEMQKGQEGLKWLEAWPLINLSRSSADTK